MSEKFRSRKNEAFPLEDEGGDEEFVKGSHKKSKGGRVRGVGKGGRKLVGSDEDDSLNISFPVASTRTPYSNRIRPVEVATPEPVSAMPVESTVRGVRASAPDRAPVNKLPELIKDSAELVEYIKNLLETIPLGIDLENIKTRIPDEALHAFRSLNPSYQNVRVEPVGDRRVIRYRWKGMERGLTHSQLVQVLRDAVDPKKKNEGKSPRSAAKSSVRLNKEDWDAINHAVLGMIPDQEINNVGEPVYFGEDEDFEEVNTDGMSPEEQQVKTPSYKVPKQTLSNSLANNSKLAALREKLTGKVESAVDTTALQSAEEEHIEVVDEIEEEQYDIAQPSIQNWSYIKSLKNKKFNDNSPFSERLREVLREIGATNLTYTDAKKNVITVTLRNQHGIYTETEMTQTEAASFLLQCKELFDESDFVVGEKIESKSAPQGGDPVEGSNAQTLGEAMDEIAGQPTPYDVAPDAKNDVENSEVAPVEPLVDLDVEPIPVDVFRKKRKEWTEKDMKQNAAEKFESEFGISRQELMGVPGFESLSAPQQKMVFENLVQSTFGRIKEETVSQYPNTVQGRRNEAIAAYGLFAGRAWAGIREALTKDFNMLSIEQEVADSVKKGGLKVHGDIIAQLTRSMANFGPRVHEDPATGGLLVDLVNIDFDRVHRRKEYKAISNLNSIAHEFAKMPAAWKEHTLGVDAAKANEWKVTQLFKAQFSDERKHQLIYEETSKAFAEAKAVLERTLREDKKSDQEIAKILLGVDQRVQQLQFIQTSPDAITELSNIQDKNIYYETAKSLVGKSGLGYMALGYVSRTALTGLIGWFAAPVVSSGLAASRSWNKTAAEMRERDRNARMGVTDTKEGSLNIVSAESLIKKTKALIDQYHSLSVRIEECQYTWQDPKDLQAAMKTTLSRLDERISFIRDKQNLNRVNYGARDTYIGRQVELYEILGEGAVIIQNEMLPIGNTVGEQIKRSTIVSPENSDKESGDTRSELKQRLSEFLAHKESSIDSKRRTYRRQELTAQALKAGGMALAGTFLAEYFRSGGGSGAAAEASRAGVSGSGPQTAVLESEFGPAVSGETSYEIKRGDTLTKILKEHMPRISNLENAAAKERFLANVFKSLTSEELAEVGIRSGDVNKIYTGDTIDLEKLEKIIEAKPAFPPVTDVNVETKVPLGSNEILPESATSATSKIDVATEKFIENSRIRSEYMEGAVDPSKTTVEEVIDLNRKEKIKVLDKFILDHFFPNSQIEKINEMKVIHVFSPELSTPSMKELQSILMVAKQPPLNIVPIKDETVVHAIHRITTELSKYEDSAKYNPEIQKLFKKINLSTT